MIVTTLLPQTGFVRPSDKELISLQAIVVAAHSWLTDVDECEFRRAFVAAGLMCRTKAPVQNRYFAAFVHAANDLLVGRLGLEEIQGPAFLCAVIAHGDVPWQAPDPSIGRALAVALNEHSGLRCSNRWHDILRGANLLAPVAPPPTHPSQRVPIPAIYRTDGMQLRSVPSGGENVGFSGASQ